MFIRIILSAIQKGKLNFFFTFKKDLKIFSFNRTKVNE